jgi:hypothetical protein
MRKSKAFTAEIAENAENEKNTKPKKQVIEVVNVRTHSPVSRSWASSYDRGSSRRFGVLGGELLYWFFATVRISSTNPAIIPRSNPTM